MTMLLQPSARPAPPAAAEPPAQPGARHPATPPVALSMREFLAWVARAPRSYAEAIEVWQTSCPRNSVWEDAIADRLIHLETGDGGRMVQTRVTLSPLGRSLLEST